MGKTFNTTLNPTSFGFFDADKIFQKDADKVVTFVLRKLGNDIIDVHLTRKMIWNCFEEATLSFNSHIIEYQAKSNLQHLLGFQTGSVDPNNANTAEMDVNLTDNYIRPNMEFILRQTEPYAAAIGYGQSQDTFSGSIDLEHGKQDYDLYNDLKGPQGERLVNFMPSGSKGRMKVLEVYHHGPHSFYGGYFGAYYGGWGAAGSGHGGSGHGGYGYANYAVLPTFETVLASGMFETQSRIRASHYRYRIDGRHLRIFPIPGHHHGYNFFHQVRGHQHDSGSLHHGERLWVRVRFPGNPAPGIMPTVTGSAGELRETIQDDTIYGASSPANIPYGLITYRTLNPWAKNWIFQYTLALCTELLGIVRSKYKSYPIPGGADVQLDGDDLKQQGREDQNTLLYGEGGLQQKLENLTYDKLAELEANKAENYLRKLQLTPMPPRYVISYTTNRQ